MFAKNALIVSFLSIPKLKFGPGSSCNLRNCFLRFCGRSLFFLILLLPGCTGNLKSWSPCPPQPPFPIQFTVLLLYESTYGFGTRSRRLKLYQNVIQNVMSSRRGCSCSTECGSGPSKVRLRTTRVWTQPTRSLGRVVFDHGNFTSTREFDFSRAKFYKITRLVMLNSILQENMMSMLLLCCPIPLRSPFSHFWGIARYRVFHKLPQIYTANHAIFPIQMYDIIVKI